MKNIGYIIRNTKQQKQFWQNYIGGQKYEYFITLTFIRRLSDNESIETLKHFVRRLISYCPRKKRHLVRGIVVAERSKRNVKFDGVLHFHIALKGIKGAVLDSLVWLQNRILKLTGRLTSRKGKPLCRADSVDIKDVYSTSGLAKYLSKDIRGQRCAVGDSIWPFDHSGVRHIDLPKPHGY